MFPLPKAFTKRSGRRTAVVLLIMLEIGSAILISGLAKLRWTQARQNRNVGAMRGVKSEFSTEQVRKMSELLTDTEPYVTDREGWGVRPRLPEDLGIPEDLQRRIASDWLDPTAEPKSNPFKRSPATQPER